ncbi:MAG: FecR domain-containing protein [Bacteroidota bacterium]
MNNDYLTHDIDTLASDERFVAWTKGWAPPHEQKAWTDWVTQHPDKETIVAEAKAIVEALEFKAVDPLPISKGQLWKRIGDTLAEEDTPVQPSKTRIRVLQFTALAVAAVIAWIIFNPFYSPELKTIEATAGQQLAVNLPDASTIILNAGSTIQFDEQNFLENRTVQLRGEGFFEVQKGNTFLVKTQQGQVEVLGTSFNVYDRPDNFEVVCSTGKVQVSAKGIKETALLTPGFKTTRNQNMAVDSIKLETALAWMDGRYTFDAKPLSTVFESLERQFDIQIRYNETIAEKLYTGGYTIDDLDSALYEVTWPMELDYNIEENTVTIE